MVVCISVVAATGCTIATPRARRWIVSSTRIIATDTHCEAVEQTLTANSTAKPDGLTRKTVNDTMHTLPSILIPEHAFLDADGNY